MNSGDHSKILRVLKLIQYLSVPPGKTIEKLIKLLGVSKASVYRYINILRDIGYIIDSNEMAQYSIDDSRSFYHLTSEEKNLISSLINSTKEQNQTTHNILHKLHISATLPDPIHAGAIFRMRLVSLISKAISARIPLRLIQYQSTESGSDASDRNILPLYLDENKLSVTAWDIDKAAYRIFKIQRMVDVELPDQKPVMPNLPEAPEIDIFGMGGTQLYEITLLLSIRANAIIREEYNKSHYYIHENPGNTSFPYKLEIRVNGYEGIGRFVLGMMTEIKISGDEGFKDYIRKKINSMTILTN